MPHRPNLTPATTPKRWSGALGLASVGALLGLETGAMESRWIAYREFFPLEAFSQEALRVCLHYMIFFGLLALILGVLRRWQKPQRVLCTLALLDALWLLPYQASSPWFAGFGIALVIAACGLYLRSSRRLRATYLCLDFIFSLYLLGTYPLLPSTTPIPTQKNLPNIVLVVIDTLRADHLSCYGYRTEGARTTPSLDALAAHGTRFSHAYAQAPWTRPSTASLFTGLYPASHGIVTPYDVLGGNLPTVASLLQTRGYHTVGFSANPQIAPAFGFQQGFQRFWNSTTHIDTASAGVHLGNKLLRAFGFETTYSTRPTRGVLHSTADDLNQAVEQWLPHRPSTGPTFLYLHYLDPHDPYTAPEDLLGLQPGPTVEESKLYASQELPPYPLEGSRLPSLSKEEMRELQRRYDTEIRFVDNRVGQLLQNLRKAGVWREQDYLFITADHGEEFHEHQQWQHGRSLFEEMIHVPLLVVGPTVPVAKVSSMPVELVDILPTIAQWCGGEPPFPQHGEALFGKRSKTLAFAHRPRDQFPIWSLRSKTQKLIWVGKDSQRMELAYNMETDPLESVPIKADSVQSATFSELRKALAILEKTSAALRQGDTETKKLQAAALRDLEQLGYVDGLREE